MGETPETKAPPEPSGWVKFWRWLASLDLTKPPAPVLRYVGILVVALIYLLSCALAGHALTSLNDWLWAAILVGFLILPDLAGFAIGGFRVDLKQAQDEIASLRLRLDIRQQVINQIYALSTDAQVGERTSRRPRVIGPRDGDAGEDQDVSL